MAKRAAYISGLGALHDIDAAISRARADLARANEMPSRISAALVEIGKQKAGLWENIAKTRIEEQASGQGDETLGYIDRQIEKLIAAHKRIEIKTAREAEKLQARISALEAKRRAQEKLVKQAVEAYEKAASASYLRLKQTSEYKQLLQKQKKLSDIIARVDQKLSLAEDDVKQKGEAYRQDIFFNYLLARRFGTKQAKGWGLTKWLDKILAKKMKYKQALLNYNSLLAIPKRLKNHLADLQEDYDKTGRELNRKQANALQKDGVARLKNASLKEQKKLEKIDDDIERAEEEHKGVRARQAAINAGDSEPYNAAIDMLVDLLQRKSLPDLRRIAAYTLSRDDDEAVAALADLARREQDLMDERNEAIKIINGYRRRLSELEDLRRRFKSRRYDAPSSQFPGGLFGQILGQLLIGALNSSDVWRQIERAQRTIPSRRLPDFGGGGWGGARRLPRRMPRRIPGRFPAGRRGGGFGGFPDSFPGGMGGGSFPRPPKIRPPKGNGGFRTGGGF